MNKIIKLLKKDTNNLENIIYRKKYIGLTKIFIIYNETLVSSDKVSDFIIRSLDNITPFLLLVVPDVKSKCAKSLEFMLHVKSFLVLYIFS